VMESLLEALPPLRMALTRCVRSSVSMWKLGLITSSSACQEKR
jgi:hypothetical protein